MRAAALALLLCACIDWEAERRAALCLKGNACDAGAAGGGAAANGGGSAASGGGSAVGGGGAATGGGSAAGGGGSPMGGGSATGGGGVVFSSDAGCVVSHGVDWCPLPDLYVPNDAGHPSIRLADCANGYVCFCASQPTSPASATVGDVSPSSGLHLATSTVPGGCKGLSASGSTAWIFSIDEVRAKQVTTQYVRGAASTTTGPELDDPTLDTTGGAAWVSSDGGWYLVATGTQGQVLAWTEFSPSLPGSRALSASNLFVYEPAVLPDHSGVVVPYFDDPNAGVVFIREGGMSSQPYPNPSGLTPRGRTLVAATDTSIFIAWAGGAELDIFHFRSGGGPFDDELQTGDDNLVGLVAADDQSIFAVSQGFNTIDVIAMGYDNAFSHAATSITADPRVESVALLPGRTLALAAICREQIGICDHAGQGFIGFYVVP